MCQNCENEKQRLVEIAAANPFPCIVCARPDVVGIGTWIPGQSHRLALGATDEESPAFAFWLCHEHIDTTQENEKSITQSILREMRAGKSHRV